MAAWPLGRLAAGQEGSARHAGCCAHIRPIAQGSWSGGACGFVPHAIAP
ncbi:hypothetical protein [Acetobacter sp.]